MDRLGFIIATFLVFLLTHLPVSTAETFEFPAQYATIPVREIGAPIPIEVHHGFIFVKARVNGCRPLSLVLDTGASVSVIDASVAAKIGLKASRQVTGLGGAGRFSSVLFSGATVSVGGAKAVGQNVAITRLGHLSNAMERQLDGVLGGEFLQHFVVSIDYRKKTIRFFDPQTYRYAGTGESVPLTFDLTIPIVKAILEPPNARPVRGKFAIDTGSNGPLGVTQAFVASHKALQTMVANAKRTRALTLGGITHDAFVTLKSVRIGSQNFNPQAKLAVDRLSGKTFGPDCDGLIGSVLLRDFKLVLNYPHSRIIFERFR